MADEVKESHISWQPIDTFEGSSPHEDVLIYGPSYDYDGREMTGPQPWLSGTCEPDEDGLFLVEEGWLVKPTHFARIGKP